MLLCVLFAFSLTFCSLFTGGPRLCLGQRMAHVEISFIIASLFQKYKFTYDGTLPPPVKSVIALRMIEGLPVKVELR
jgi:cytochrome P450